MRNPAAGLLIVALVAAQPSYGSGDLDGKVDHALRFAGDQLTSSLAHFGDSVKYPRSSGEGGWTCVPPSDWTSGFFPGCLWLMYDWTRDDTFRDAANRWTDGLEDQKLNRRTHDIGFMMFCSFGNGYRLSGREHDRDVLLQAARTLARRYSPRIGCVKSWDWSREWHYPVIIDNMMNLELLFWASKNGGGDTLRQIAVNHALKTIQNHFRPDGSTYHVVDYDTVTGVVRKRVTHQGYADESVWARGQAWAVYGFTMAYRETGDKRFLKTAEKAALYFINHMPPDGVPCWDFLASGCPDAQRDASAAAIAASALIELGGMAEAAAGRAMYRSSAEKILSSLCSSAYLAEGSPSMGILNHAVGNMPGKGEVDVSLIYGDYYFLEALLRYHRSPRR